MNNEHTAELPFDYQTLDLLKHLYPRISVPAIIATAMNFNFDYILTCGALSNLNCQAQSKAKPSYLDCIENIVLPGPRKATTDYHMKDLDAISFRNGKQENRLSIHD